jgi:hypothetical protein
MSGAKFHTHTNLQLCEFYFFIFRKHLRRQNILNWMVALPEFNLLFLMNQVSIFYCSKPLNSTTSISISLKTIF